MLKKYMIPLSMRPRKLMEVSSILLFIGLWLLSPVCNVSAEEVTKDHLSLWANQQSTKLQKRIAIYRKREAQALGALKKSRSVFIHAEEINDQQAAAIARRAVAISERAIAKLRSKRLADEARLAAVEKAHRFKSKNHFAVTSMIKGEVYKKTDVDREVFDGKAPLVEGDEISTGSDGFAEIIFTDGSKIKLGPNSSFKVARLGKRRSIYEVLKGRVHAEYACIKRSKMPCRGRLNVRTPMAHIGVRGTEFSLEVQPGDSVKVMVFEGVLQLSEPDGAGDGITIMVRAGEKAAFHEDGSIVGPIAIDAGSLDRWWEE